MRLASLIRVAGEHERLAEDVRLPEPGRALVVVLPDGSRAAGVLVSAERADDHHLRVVVDVPDAPGA